MRGDLPLTVIQSADGIPELPPERFEDATQVRQLSKLMIGADQRRAWMRERVDALVNGFPTYPQSVTASKGLGWFPRVNYREAEGLIQAQQTPLFDLLNEVDHVMEIELDPDVVKASSSEELDNWETSIEKNWTWLLMKRWRQAFNFHIPMQQREMLVHGMGAHVWPNRRWTPRTPRNGQILFPEATSLDFNQEGEYFMLRDWVPGVNVYEFIRNEKTASKLGWYPDNVWKTLAQATRKNQRIRTYGQIEEIQRKARRGDIGYWGTSEVGLWMNWMFVKEYEGGYSLYAIEENITVPNADKESGGYLFRKRFMWDEDEGWPLVLFPYDIGIGDIHSVRGLGWRTKDFFELSNRVNNSMVAQVLISAFPMFQQTMDVDGDKLKLMRAGALNIIPRGLQQLQWQFPPLNNSGLSLQEHLHSTLDENNQSFTGNSPEPKDRETRYSYAQRSQDAAKVANGMQSMYESNYQQFLDKMYRLCINTPKGSLPYQKYAQEFKDRCKRDGVPDVAVTERAIGQITEVTSSGSGSAALRLQALLTLWQYIYPVTSEDRKITIERDTVGTLMGKSKVERYARSATETDLPSQDESLAMQESNGLALGGQAILGAGQNDVIHAQNHLAKGMELEQKCESGQEDPQKCAIGIAALLQHAGEHLQRIQGVPQRKQEFQQLEQAWKELAQYLKSLQSELQSQNGQVPPEQQVSEDFQLKSAKLQGDMAIKQQKAQADIALKAQKAGVSNRLADVKTASAIHRDNVKTGVGMMRENAKTAHGMNLENVKTRAAVNRQATAPRGK